MTVEITADVRIASGQSVSLTVEEVDTGKSDTIDLIDGTHTYSSQALDGDPSYEYQVSVDLSASSPEATPTVTLLGISVPGSVALREQTRDRSTVQWSDKAVLNEVATAEAGEYRIELETEDGLVVEQTAEDFRYTEELNAARDATATVESRPWLEDLTFLDAEARVYDARDERIFTGDIKELEFEQPDSLCDLSIKNKGRRLRGNAVHVMTNGDIVPDVMAEIVDKFNAWDGEMGGENVGLELLNLTRDTHGSLSVPDGTSGTAYFTHVGPRAHELNPLYVKAYTPTDGDVTVTVDSGNATYTTSLSAFSDHEYGRWYQITPEGLSDAWYDVEIELNGDAILHDWRAVTTPELWRDVASVDPGTYQYSAGMYSESHPFATVQSPRVVDTGSALRTRQKASWHVVTSGDSWASGGSDPNTVSGYYWTSDDTTLRDLVDLDFEDEFPAWQLWARVRMHQDNGVGSCDYRIKTVSGNEEYDDSIDTSNIGRGYEWVKIYDSTDDDATDIRYDISYLQSSEEVSIRGRNTASMDVLRFGEFAVTVGENADLGFDYDFSDSLKNGHLSRPMRYAAGYLDVEPREFGGNIVDAKTECTLTNTADTRDPWGPLQTTERNDFDEGTGYYPQSETTSDFVFLGGQHHQVRVYLAPAGERDSGTPRLGYQGMELTDVSVTGSFDNMPRLFSQEITDNALAALNEALEDTQFVFRLEGDTVTIFREGSSKTEVDLIDESVKSSVSTEGVYASCEVFGLGGIRSGVIEADDPPPNVSDHRELREQKVDTRREAIAKAEAFIEQNGDVEYGGEIETLPTFAPVGEVLDGRHFTHGKDLIIKSVNYGRGRATITLGRMENIADELIGLKNDTRNTNERVTSPD